MTSVDVWSDLEAALLGGEEAQHELLPMDEIVDSLNIELRERFESALFIIVKKNFNSTVKDGIAKRGINKLQIDHVLATLLNKRHDEANFYNYRNTYVVKTVAGTNYLYAKKESKTKNNNGDGGLIVALEDMYATCVKLHKSIGSQGRCGMLKEGDKQFGNVTRPIVDMFLDFSEEYQLKQKRKKNHGLVVKPIVSCKYVIIQS